MIDVARPRAVPARDSYRAVCDLLRNLANVEKLRSNALVTHLFADLDDANERAHFVRGIVEAGIAAMSEDRTAAPSHEQRRRMQAILVRCDRNGERNSAVARDLNVCERQFYRDKRRASAYIALLVAKATAPVRAHAVDLIDVAEIAFEGAARLRDLGQAQAAMQTYDDIIATGDDLRFARAYAERLATARGGEIDAPSAQLSAHVATRFAALDRRDPALWLETTWADAVAAATAHDRPRAVRACRTIADAVLAGTLGPSARAAHLFVRANALLADPILALGETAAERALSCASRMLDRCVDAPAHVRSAVILARWQRAFAAGRYSACAELYERFAPVCREAGLLVTLRDLEYSFSMVARQAGLTERAVVHARRALACNAVAASSVATNVLVHVNLARALDASGNAPGWDASIAAANACRPDAANARAIHLACAERSLRLADFPAAERSAREALREYERVGEERYAGFALRIAAEAAQAAGNVREAHEAIEESVELLERHGTNFARAQAYAASSRICNRREHAERAEHLMAAFAS